MLVNLSNVEILLTKPKFRAKKTLFNDDEVDINSATLQNSWNLVSKPLPKD